MKKYLQGIILTFCIVFATSGSEILAGNDEAYKVETIKKSSFNELASRVFEIKNMDRSTMSSEERQDLKSELRLIKSSLNDASQTAERSNGGIYISVGALLIIILLLVIIF
jgi:hypothetical protein